MNGRGHGLIVTHVACEGQAVDAQCPTFRGQGIEIAGRAHRITWISHRPCNIESRDPYPFAGQGQGDARPCPCAAPVIKATCPARSDVA